tara:strand:- start:170 stop:553 length:384 start_codon:yes stop_codon:yes gene_type:complete
MNHLLIKWRIKMKQTINQTQFIDAFQNRITYKDNFSYDGLVLLYEYFEEFEADTESEIELDVIAICCDFSEMDKADFLSAYGIPPQQQDTWYDLDDDEQAEYIKEYLSEQTGFIGYTDDKTFDLCSW